MSLIQPENFSEEDKNVFAELGAMAPAILAALLREPQLTPENWQPPEIISLTDPSKREKITEINQLLSQQPNAEYARPYHAAIKELTELQHFFTGLMSRCGITDSDSVDDIAEKLRRTFANQTSGIAEDLDSTEIRQLTIDSSIFRDLAYLVYETSQIDTASPEKFIEHARLIWHEGTASASLYVDEKIDQLLKKTRMLGLIPFETLDRLANLKIVVLGASVASSTIDLLVAMGAQNIRFIDDGYLEPSNGQKMPGGFPADVNKNGFSKAEAVAQAIYQRNPYGNYQFHIGRVVMAEDEKRENFDDQSLSDMLEDAGLVIEVIDDPRTKARIRQSMAEKAPNTPLLFLADVGTDAFAGIEIPGEKQPFNQQFTPSQTEYLNTITEKGYTSPLDVVKSVQLMVKGQLPTEHKLQTILAYQGMIPYFSQTGIAARQSASLGVTEILKLLQGKEVAGRNFQGKTIASSLNEYDPKNTKCIETIFEAITR